MLYILLNVFYHTTYIVQDSWQQKACF